MGCIGWIFTATVVHGPVENRGRLAGKSQACDVDIVAQKQNSFHHIHHSVPFYCGYNIRILFAMRPTARYMY